MKDYLFKQYLAVALLFFFFQANCKKSNVYIDDQVHHFPKVSNTNSSTYQLISHGRPGELLINGEWKNAKKIATWLKEFGIGNAEFNRKSNQSSIVNHLNIYGCEFAKGKKGLAVVKYLERTLSISVSASTNITGRDGDWLLEVGPKKNIITNISYQGNLQTCVCDTTVDCWGVSTYCTGWYSTTTNFDVMGANASTWLKANKWNIDIHGQQTANTKPGGINSGTFGGAGGLVLKDYTTTVGDNYTEQFYLSKISEAGGPYTNNGPVVLRVVDKASGTVLQTINLIPGGIYTGGWFTLNFTAIGTTSEIQVGYTNPTTENVMGRNWMFFPYPLIDKTTGVITNELSSITPSSPVTATSSPSIICSGTSSTLSASCGTNEFAAYYSNSALSSLIGTGATLTVSPTTTTTYYVSCNSGCNCKSVAVPVTVTVNSLPAAPTVTPGSVCNGSSVALVGSCASGSTLTWYDASTAGNVVTSPVSPTVNTTYYGSCVSSAGCASSTRTSDLITVSALPTITPASTSTCMGTDLVLTGSATPNSTAAWTSSNTAVGTINATTTTGTFHPLSVGTTTITYKNSNNCVVTRDITVNATPTAPTVIPTTVCINAGTTLQGSCATGTLQWYSAATPTISTTPISSTVTTVSTTAGTKNYYAACVLGSCISPSTTDVITIVAKPTTTPVISGTATICAGGSTSLTSATNCGTGNTLTWYSDASLTTKVGTSSPLSVSPNSTTIYYASCVNGSCQGPVSNSITITVTPIPSAPTSLSSSNSNLCAGASTSLSGTCTTSGITLKWYSESTLTTLLGSGTPLSVSPQSSTTYYAVCNNSCVSSVSSLSVTVIPKPSSPNITPTSATICSGTSTNLVASGCSGTVNWYVSGSSTIAFTGTTFPASPTTTTSYVATCTINGCTSANSSAITVTVVTPNGATMSSSTTSLCNGSTVTFTGTCASPGVLTWYKNGSSSPFATGLTGISDTPTADATYNAVCTTGSTAVNAISCATSTNTLTVTVAAVVAAPTVNPTASSICSGQSVTLTASCTSGSVSWTTGETTSSITVSPVITTTYSANCVSNGCTSAAGSSVITVTTTPSAPTLLSSNKSIVCVGGTISLSGTCDFGSIKWYSDAALTSSIGSGSPLSQIPNTAGTITYYANCVNGTCAGLSANTVVTVLTLPNVPTGLGSNPSTICSGSNTTLSGTCESGQTLNWYSDATLTTLLGTSNYTTANLTTNTTYYAACDNGTCKGSSANVTVNVINSLAPTISSTSTQVCTGSSTTLTANGCSGTITWSKDGTVLSSTGSTYQATDAGTYTATCTTSGCTSVASNAITITLFCESPSMTVIKSSNVTSPVSVGSVITYTFKVKNTGNVVLNSVGVSETSFTGIGTTPVATWQSSDAGSSSGTLKVGETATYTATYTVTAADITAGKVTNQASGSGTSPGGTGVTGTSDSGNPTDETGSPTDPTTTTLEAPAMTVIKSSSVTSPVSVGSVITYTFKVKNTGNVVLNSVNVSETSFTGTGTTPVATWQSSDAGSSSGTLKVGETATFTATYTVTAADIAAGKVTNQASGSGTSPGGTGVTGTSDSGNPTDETGSPTDPTKTTLCSSPSVPVATSPQSMCAGESKNLSATCTSSTLVWYSDATLGSVVSNPVSPAATTDYYAVCKVGACVSASTKVTLTVNPLPTATASNSCTGSIIVLTASDAGTGATYAWTGPNNYTSSIQNPAQFPYDNTNLNGTYTLTVTLNGCTAISNTTLACTSPLPVKLISFTATELNEGIQLNWETSEEVNSAYFEIQRSSDAINFEGIGKVKSNGNSNVINDYAYLDVSAQGNILYYRLKTVDLDQTYDISKIISVIRNTNGSSLLYPNPTNGNILSLKGITEPVQNIILTDHKGFVNQLTFSCDDRCELTVHLPNGLNNGNYVLTIFTQKNKIVKKLNINK